MTKLPVLLGRRSYENASTKTKKQYELQRFAGPHPAQLGKAADSDAEEDSFLHKGIRKVEALVSGRPGALSKLMMGSLALNASLLLIILLVVLRPALIRRPAGRKSEVQFSKCEVDMDWLRARVRDNGQEVCSRRVIYSPAAWEGDFVANMSRYQCGEANYSAGAFLGICPALCERVKLYTPLVREWARVVEDQSAWRKSELLQSSSLPPSLHPSLHPSPGTWSSFKITTSCPDGSTTTVEAPIEPLVSFLRHPLALCVDGNGDHLFDKSYMLFGIPTSIITGRRFLFDIGASQYNSGFGGASQSWFVERYKTLLDVDFDRIFAWEYGGNQVERLSETPFEILTKTSYFVIPASGEPSKCHNPWNFIKSVCKPGDFVVVKLDMDTPVVETALVEQLLEDKTMATLIDDFYFEDHASKSPMEYHGWSLGAKDHDLTRSIQIFAQLREMGIRAHSWV